MSIAFHISSCLKRFYYSIKIGTLELEYILTKGVNVGTISCKWALSLLLSAILSFTFAAPAVSEVVVYDIVTLTGEEVMLRAETRGGLFSRKGELVEFLVDGKSVGKNLSGTDGFAIKEFVPMKAGLYKITAISGKSRDDGVLLAVNKKAKLVFIDVEGSVLEGPFALQAKPGSAKAVKRIQGKFPVVFLQKGLLAIRSIRLWLKKNDFPEAPVMPWNKGEIFREIREKKLKIKAVIGGPEVIESAEMQESLAFSFDSMEEVEVVENWEEIVKKLK